MSLLLLTLACSPVTVRGEADLEAQSLQLESATVDTTVCSDDVPCDGTVAATGALAVTTGEGGALTVGVGELSVAVHTPTGVDLSEHAGATVSAAVVTDWMVAPSLQLSDDTGVVYVVEAGSGTAFEAIEVAYGEVLGEVVDEADYLLTFHALDVTTDDGVIPVKPGEIVTIHLDGQAYRFGAIAAYTTETIEGGEYMDCGGEAPMLSYELSRIAEDRTFDVVKRAASVEMAKFSGCGG